MQDILLDRQTATRPYLNNEVLQRMVHDHLNGNGNYLNEIDRILTVELIQRLLIDI